MSCNDCGSGGKIVKYDSAPGVQGFNGWTPELANAVDGVRFVEQVVDWFGGTGTKPAVGVYVGAIGFVDGIAQGVDIRGAQGLVGPIGPAGPVGGVGTGTPGLGVPTGGLKSQVLRKKSNTSFDTEWGNEYKTTATSPNVVVSDSVIGTSVVFTTSASSDVMAYAPGVRIRAGLAGSEGTNYIEGKVVSYSGTSLTTTVDSYMGSGTLNAWNLNLGSDTPIQIINGVANLYVSQLGGSDTTGDGSINKPYAKIEKGVAMAGNNQTVVVFAGSYTNSTNVVKATGIRYTLSFFPNVIITQNVTAFYDSEITNASRVDIYGEPNIDSRSVANYTFRVKQVCKLYLGKIDCQQALNAQTYAGNVSGNALANEITVIKIREVNYFNTTPTTSYAIRFFGATGSIGAVPAKNNSVDFSIYAINFIADSSTGATVVKFIQIADIYSLFISNSYIYHGGGFSLSNPIIFDFVGGTPPAEISVSNTSIRLGGNGVTGCILFALDTTTLLKNFFKNITVSISPCTIFKYGGTSNQAVNAEDIYVLTGSTAVNSTGVGVLTIASGNQFSASGTTSATSTTSRIYLLNNSTGGIATIKN